MTLLGRQGYVKEMKGLYLYLASDVSSYQTGSDVVINGGYILPSSMHLQSESGLEP